jgi:arylsulfatase A-like enzyme
VGSSEFRYLDSLALADRALGRIRAKMEQSGVWDDTTILLSSDHWCRTALSIDGKLDHRVPFLLKLPRQTRALALREPFNTVLSRELLFSVLRGDLRRPEEVAAWLKAHRGTLTESPYNAN